MVAQQNCDRNRLTSLLADRLPAAQLDDTCRHLETCADCRSELESLAADNGIWDDMPRYLRTDDIDPDRTKSLLPTNLPFDTGSPSTSLAIATVLDQLAPSDNPAMLGRLGEYEILEVLGCGGMGVVLKGYDRSLNRYVAVKTLSPYFASNAAARKRFAREAKAAAAVVHQHVVAVHGVEGDAKLPYFVMQFVAGPSLEERINAEAPMDVKDILRIGMQAAQGLAAAHAQGLVHRDIKPSNILLESDVERVLLTDFGLARAVDDASMTRSGVLAGTPQFMSPEQAQGESVDHRSDLFSLGSVLYAMCTGRSPFRAETPMGVLRRISDQPHRPVRQVNPDIPVWLEEIIDRLLAKDADERFQTADEVAEVLGRWLSHLQQPDTVQPPKATKKPRSGMAQQPPSRFRFAALAAAGGMLLVLAAVVIVLELGKGTLTIESAEADIPIRIMQGDKVYDQMTVSASGNSVRIAAGRYRIEIAGNHDGLVVANDQVTVTRGGTHVVKIVREIVRKVGDDAKPPAVGGPGPGVAVKPRVSVAEKLLGTWVLEGTKDGAKPETITISRHLAATATGPARAERREEMRIRFTDVAGNQQQGRVGLSSSGTKPYMTIYVIASDGIRREWSANYALKGDKLTLEFRAVNVMGGGNNRPLDWAAMAEQKTSPRQMRGTYIRAEEKVSVAANAAYGERSLVDAVREFNEKHADHPIGKSQPPLTDEEVVAAILWTIDVEKKADIPSVDEFRRIAEKRIMPVGWRFQAATDHSGVGESGRFQAWSIRLWPAGNVYDFPIRHHILWQLDRFGKPVELPITTDFRQDDATPLAAAINEFNAAHRSLDGQEQPPLTEREVIAAIRWWKMSRHEAPVTNGEFAAFQQIATDRQLPKGAKIEVIGHFRPGDGRDYSIWSVRIVMPRTSKPGWTYAYTIRRRFVGSQPTDDGSISWGPVAANGLQAGVRLDPNNEKYTSGDQVVPRFFYRNAGKEVLDLSFPRLMTHSYYDKLTAVDATGAPFAIETDPGPGGPVGWMQFPFPPGAQHEIGGMPIVLGDVDRGSAESVIRAKPGQSLRISFTLPNYVDRKSQPLETGELRLSLAASNTSATVDPKQTKQTHQQRAQSIIEALSTLEGARGVEISSKAGAFIVRGSASDVKRVTKALEAIDQGVKADAPKVNGSSQDEGTNRDKDRLVEAMKVAKPLANSPNLIKAVESVLAVMRGQDNENVRLQRSHFDDEWKDDVDTLLACPSHGRLAIDEMLVGETHAFAVTAPLKDKQGRHLIVEFAFERQTDGSWKLSLIDVEPADSARRDIDRFRKEYPQENVVYITLDVERPADVDEPAQPAEGTDAQVTTPLEFRQMIAGRWLLESAETQGATIKWERDDAADNSALKKEIGDLPGGASAVFDEEHVSFGPHWEQPDEQWDYHLDEEADPRRITFTRGERTMKGIIWAWKGELVISLAQAGKDFPQDFKSQGNRNFILRCRRDEADPQWLTNQAASLRAIAAELLQNGTAQQQTTAREFIAIADSFEREARFRQQAVSARLRAAELRQAGKLQQAKSLERDAEQFDAGAIVEGAERHAGQVMRDQETRFRENLKQLNLRATVLRREGRFDEADEVDREVKELLRERDPDIKRIYELNQRAAQARLDGKLQDAELFDQQADELIQKVRERYRDDDETEDKPQKTRAASGPAK